MSPQASASSLKEAGPALLLTSPTESMLVQGRGFTLFLEGTSLPLPQGLCTTSHSFWHLLSSVAMMLTSLYFHL